MMAKAKYQTRENETATRLRPTQNVTLGVGTDLMARRKVK